MMEFQGDCLVLMNFLFGHAKRGSAKNQRMHSGKLTAGPQKWWKLQRNLLFQGLAKKSGAKNVFFFGGSVFFFLGSQFESTPPQMPQDLGMVEKQSGSKGRKLLEKAVGSGEKLLLEFFGAPTKSDPNLIPKKRPKSQLSNCTKKGGVQFPPHSCYFLDYIRGWLEKTPIDLIHLWAFGSHQFFRKIQCQSVHWKITPTEVKKADWFVHLRFVWKTFLPLKYSDQKNCQHLNLSANRNLDFSFIINS